MAGKMMDDIVRCSFCNKTQAQVRKLIAGPNGTYICDECIGICSEIIEEELDYSDDRAFDDINLLTPEEMKAFLDDYVIGQDEAKKVLSVAVYNHYKRIMAEQDLGVELQKSNILMLGPTGCGKTLLAQTLAKILNVPFAIADATALTEAGYVGEDVENILLKVIQAADGDIERAEHGIIYIDEIDKIAVSSGNSNRQDPSKEGVQRDLLPIIEGSTISTKYGIIKTDYILFVAAGAFHLSKPSDLIPELQGRFPIRVELDNLDEEAMYKILTQTRSSLITQYKHLLSVEQVELVFKEDALRLLAHFAYLANQKTEDIGARRLHTILERILEDISFNAQDFCGKKVTIDKKLIKEKLANLVSNTDMSHYIL